MKKSELKEVIKGILKEETGAFNIDLNSFLGSIQENINSILEKYSQSNFGENLEKSPENWVKDFGQWFIHEGVDFIN